MHPAPIPDDVAATRVGRRIVVGPPRGTMLTETSISPVEAIVEQLPSGKALTVRCVLDEGDLERLREGGAVWVTFLNHMVPFDIAVGA